MSRLFDALKEARGFRQGTDGDAGEQVWEALGIDKNQHVSTLDVADVATVSDAMLGDLPTVPAEPASEGVPAATDFPISPVLDPTARLIPHATDPRIAEHYRRLRTKIVQLQEQKAFRSVVVTSANPQEGKTVTVLNLGLSFAALPSFRVLVVDGDLRKGTMGKWLRVPENQPGLSNLIDGSAQLEDVLLKSASLPMDFIMRGNSEIPDLQSSQLTEHFQKMCEQYDLVLIDTPPVNLIANAQVYAATCDAVLMVVRAFVTTRKEFEEAVQDLRSFRLIGTVLNAGATRRSTYQADQRAR